MMMTYTEITEPADCPRCGGPSICRRWSDHPEWPRSPQYCRACQEDRARRAEMFRVEVRNRFPEMGARLFNCLQRGYSDEGGLPALLAASDEDLLCLRNVGVKLLAEFRAIWPIPTADISTIDPWRDHVEMVAGVR